MEVFHLMRTETTPEIFLDPNDLQITMRGALFPKNAKKYYEPLLQWLNNFLVQLPETATPLSVDVKITHFNSASMAYLSQIFQIIGQMHEAGMRILIDWYTNDDDNYLREVGQELSEVSDIPFNYIEE